MERKESRQIEIRFLRDKPADQDFFGTHRDLAKAVGSALVSNPELRTIGLLGKWGSGKSTVLGELDRRIRSDPDLSDIITFTFDAWEHQGEPIRRSFLESLFRFLTTADLIEPKEWQSDIDLLSGRLDVTENIETPELTKSAKRLLWSLALLPLGLSLFGLDTLQDGLGKTTTLAGQIALGISLICFAVPGALIFQALVKTGGTGKKPDEEDVVGLIINKKVNRVKTKTIKSPEPTAIEFSETCDGLVSEVKKRGRRLLCVLDNLDRLPAQDALDMWSTIRAIFANINVNGIEQAHPFILVPMDHSALLESFGGEQRDERAKSFIDKTFDLTFRVPPPVRSDWKNFLRRQMETVFGKEPIEDRTMYFVERVFDSRHDQANEFPTPRIINRFVNSVAATWLSRKNDHFPLEVVSLFVSYLEDIETSVLEFTQRDELRFFDDDFPEWRDQVVALYFGVKPEKSRQVLLERPIREAIEEGDRKTFGQLMQYPGSFKVFRDALTEFKYDPSATESQNFVFKGAVMLETIRDNAEGAKRSWDYLLRRLLESMPAPELESFDQHLAPFLRNLTKRQLAKLIPVAVAWLSRRASSASDGESVTAIANIYQRLQQSDPSGKTPSITLQGEPEALINSIYWINGNNILEGSTKVEAEFSKLAPELAKLVDDEDEAVTVHEVLAFRRNFPQAFPYENVVALPPIRNASVAIIQKSGASLLTSSAARNLGVMAPMTRQSGETIDELIDAGHLQARLDEAASQNEIETVAVLIALAISRGKSFTIDLDTKETENVLDSMMQALDEFVAEPLNLIWNSQAAGSSPEFVGLALHFVVQHRTFSDGELNQIAQNPEFYFQPLGKADRAILAKKVGADERRVEHIGSLSPSQMLLDILSPLIRLGVPDAAKQCRASVENLPAESWRLYIEGKADWIFELVEKCPTDFRLTVNSTAVASIVDLINERSADFGTSERARLRRLLPHFNIHATRKLISAALGYSEAHPRHVIGILKTLNAYTTDFVANHASGEQLFTVVGGISSIADGRTWLESVADAVQTGFERLDRDSRSDILKWFASMKNSKPRIRANWIELMGTRLGFV